ncbi:uncharacterized protein LOC122526773 isoform X2 [Polistes fuscatus]|uniref:uncharacterized protein LOC122526773 isoform X2 n=1 Tax=Polistes fuscatus TaxID=30207 RepID=UPI001CAA306E|nr:uncharacterized protein LOC122526773 isoform X2 [Polistes fuscatus]
MKEILPNPNISSYNNSFVGNNGETSVNSISNDNNTRRYAVLSTEWISAIGEELGIHPLSDSILRRLAEDASYRLREILHKCITRLKHSRRKCLTSNDVNAVLTSLCNVDPVLGVPDTMPEYHSEAKVFVPNERIINLVDKVNEAVNISQDNVPFIQEMEVCDVKLTEARYNYAKRALKTLFNGSQKTFQVLVNDCANNPHLGGEGVIDRLMSIAKSMVISNNAQYTRVSIRTCQLIIAIASNSEAVYPYYLTSVDKLTELLLELLLGQSFINSNLEELFKECVLKLMLRWPSVADRYIPTLEDILLKDEKEDNEVIKKRTMARELLASVQPLLFFQSDKDSPLFIDNILKSAPPGSVIWQCVALVVCALLKSGAHGLDLTSIIEHYGDSLLPYLPIKYDNDTSEYRKTPTLPIILKSKIKYAKVRPVNTKILSDRQSAFPDSTLKGPRKEIKFAFAGGRPVPPSNLRRISLRANYQILRSEHQATLALVASRRLLVLRNINKPKLHVYNPIHICL